jgi:hypothetical protein
MSMKLQKALESLSENIQRNSPKIEEIIKNAGGTPDPALVYSAAKYFDALNKLAAE